MTGLQLTLIVASKSFGLLACSHNLVALGQSVSHASAVLRLSSGGRLWLVHVRQAVVRLLDIRVQMVQTSL